jgi:hypothetical protein
MGTEVKIVLCPGGDLSVYTRGKRRVARPAAVWANRKCAALDEAFREFHEEWDEEGELPDREDPSMAAMSKHGLSILMSMGSLRLNPKTKSLEVPLLVEWRTPSREKKKAHALLVGTRRGFNFMPPKGVPPLSFCDDIDR